MKFEVFKNENSRLFAENRLLKFALILIALSNFVFGIMAYNAVKVKNVVLVPLNLSKPVEIGRSVNEFYVIQMTRFIFDSLFNYTPATVRKQYEVVLSLFDPTVFKKYKQIFERFVADAETVQMASVFFIDKIEHSRKKRIVKVTGKRLDIIGDKVVSQEKVTYMYRYKIVYGQFRLLEFGKAKAIQKKIGKEEKE